MAVLLPKTPLSRRCLFQRRLTRRHALASAERVEGQLLDYSGGDVELLIAGGGPAGLAVAKRVAEAGLRVVVLEKDPLAYWPNNYGVWVDEFKALGLEDHLERIWPRAEVILRDGDGARRPLNRPYGRVDRRSLKEWLLQGCYDAGVEFKTCLAEGVTHEADRSVVKAIGADGIEEEILATTVLDATGHSRKLVEFDRPFEPGVQVAYGIMADVEGHPFDVDTMLFMDWRSKHLDGAPSVAARNAKLPTFLYAMPFSDTRIFLEETSLVARPGLAFDDLKERFELRMKSLGIAVRSIEEEEYCYIPMGGVLPRMPQRTVALGGTAGLVHPSTGYMVARTLQAAPEVGDAIVSGLSSLKKFKGTTPDAKRDEPFPVARTVDDVSARVWKSLWPKERLGQREFKVFGMEVLLSLDLPQTQGFFSAFFQLSDRQWQGFLSWNLTFTELILFGLALFAKSENDSRLTLLMKGTPGLMLMILEIVTGNTGTGIFFSKPEHWFIEEKPTGHS